MTLLDQMLGMLTTAYNRKPDGNIGKLLSIAATDMQQAQITLSTIRDWQDIERARGESLGRLGANLGVPREGLPDTIYRLAIITKMAAQLSGGDVDTVIGAASALLAVEPTLLQLDEVDPAKVWIMVDEIEIPDERMQIIDYIGRFVKRVVAAGVGLRIGLRQSMQMAVPAYVGVGAGAGARLVIEPIPPRIVRTSVVRMGAALMQDVRLVVRPNYE